MQDTAGQVIFFIMKVLTRGAVVLLLALMVLAILVGETGLGDVSLGGNVKLSTFFGKSALNFTLRAAIPLTLGALSGIMCERSGIINIGIEGMMLAGAFAAFVAKVQTDTLPLYASLAFGVAAALLTGALMGLFHAGMSIRFKVDQIISGTVIITLAAGLTTFLFNPDWSSAGKFGPIEIPLLSKIPVLGDVLFSNALITYATLFLVVAVHVMLFYTRWGLRTRSVGEHPRAADTVGINVNRMRYINVIIGSSLAGLAGAFLVLEAVGQFKEGMTAGRGFIALAAMIFGNWTPFGAFGASLLFGYTTALQNELLLAGVTSIPRNFIAMLPYLTTIIVLAGIVGRTRAPAAIGQVYESE
jgi:simple sugar transport system permease protein